MGTGLAVQATLEWQKKSDSRTPGAWSRSSRQSRAGSTERSETLLKRFEIVAAGSKMAKCCILDLDAVARWERVAPRFTGVADVNRLHVVKELSATEIVLTDALDEPPTDGKLLSASGW